MASPNTVPSPETSSEHALDVAVVIDVAGRDAASNFANALGRHWE
jgi:hypothetical protein